MDSPAAPTPFDPNAVASDFTRRRNWSAILLTTLPTWLLCVSTTGVILYGSPASRELLGYAPNDLLGRKLTEYVHVDDVDTFVKEFYRCMTAIAVDQATAATTATHSINLSNSVGLVNAKHDARMFLRFRGKDDRFVVLELTARAFVPDTSDSSPHAAAYTSQKEPMQRVLPAALFIAARNYPVKVTAVFDQFLELRAENEALKRRIAELLAAGYGRKETNANHNSDPLTFSNDDLNSASFLAGDLFNSDLTGWHSFGQDTDMSIHAGLNENKRMDRDDDTEFVQLNTHGFDTATARDTFSSVENDAVLFAGAGQQPRKKSRTSITLDPHLAPHIPGSHVLSYPSSSIAPSFGFTVTDSAQNYPQHAPDLSMISPMQLEGYQEQHVYLGYGLTRSISPQGSNSASSQTPSNVGTVMYNTFIPSNIPSNFSMPPANVMSSSQMCMINYNNATTLDTTAAPKLTSTTMNVSTAPLLNTTNTTISSSLSANANVIIHVCTDCGTTESPEWRKGPSGPKTLCNACGLRWAKKNRKENEEAAAAAMARANLMHAEHHGDLRHPP